MEGVKETVGAFVLYLFSSSLSVDLFNSELI